MPPEEESYSADVILHTLNLTYTGCMGVFLVEPSHAIAFYGRKGSVRAGLMVQQSTEACKLISSIPVWMGYAAKIKARTISLQEVNDMIVGLKRLDKEDLKRPVFNSITDSPHGDLETLGVISLPRPNLLSHWLPPLPPESDPWEWLMCQYSTTSPSS